MISEIFLVTAKGMINRFNVGTIRMSSVGSRGTRGIKLKEGDKTISAIVRMPTPSSYAVIITKQGFGKRLKLLDCKMGTCGSGGGRGIKLRSTDSVIAACYAEEFYDLVIMTAKGLRIQINVKDIPVLSQMTKGSRLIKLNEGDSVSVATAFNFIPYEKTDEVIKKTA